MLVKRIACFLECFDICRRQQCIIVKHLLEVRHEPMGIDTVTMEAAAHLIVDSATSHCTERLTGHCQWQFLVAHLYMRSKSRSSDA